MIALITAVIELVALIVKNWFEKDAAEKARKDDLHAQAANAIKSGDVSRINAVFQQLRA